MEYLKTYYSLEKHLEETVKFNPQFEILNAIWKLNKKNLSAALSNVSQYFPHYSLHEKSHSTTIINNIELFLGEERIKKLSPTNTWLLLMASFTHDLGMVVFQELIEKEWMSTEFQDFLIEICEWDDINLSESGKILTTLQRAIKHKEHNWEPEISPIQIKNSVTLVVAEYMRRIHHKRSSDILKGLDKTFNDVASSFYSDQIPNRLLNLLGDIAFLHGVEFYEILKRLDFESNGLSNDKINPRFIAAMLRLGDLLDIDDGRFNIFTSQVFKLPESSNLHKKKHSSIKHFLITPDAIEITADCPEEQVYRLARNWFDWLELEVENLNKEWSNIAPLDLTGSAPRIPKGKIKVFYNNSSADEDLLNLKFQVSNEKIFEILEGGSIYEKAEFTFIRELVQNSLDASKIQLWSEIEKGTYDFVFREHFKNGKLTHDEIINKIIFPDDIPEALQKSFQIYLNLKWDEDKNNLIIEIVDSGTGISNKDLIRMTSKVGQSRRENKQYNEMLSRMPFWLKPTGAFGIGLQSLFIITDSFNVYTKADGENAKKITFRSSKKGKYSTATDFSTINQRGTKVEIIIPEKKFQDVFGTSFGWDIISSYDPFTDEYGNIYIHKIRQYIEEVLFRIDNLHVNFFGKDINANSVEGSNWEIDNGANNRDSVLKIFYKNDEIYFMFFENNIGSQFTLRYFATDLLDYENHWPKYHMKFFVRDIPVETNQIYYNHLSFAKLYWNFMSQSSDKILSITREKFLVKEKQKVENQFLRDVLPKTLPLISDFLSFKLDDFKAKFSSIENASIIYFKIILTLRVNRISTPKIDDSLLQNNLPDSVLTKDDQAVSMHDFLNAETFLIPINRKYVPNSAKLVKQQLIETRSQNDSNNITIWKPESFTTYLRLYYSISEIAYYDNGHVLKLIRNEKNSESINIYSGYNYYLESILESPSLSNRTWTYIPQKYSEQLSVLNEYNSGFERFPYLSKSSLISPFANKEQFSDVANRYGLTKDRDSIKELLTNEILKTYITDSLIEWIILNNPDSSIIRTSDSILDSYRELIIDMIINVVSSTDNNN